MSEVRRGLGRIFQDWEIVFGNCMILLGLDSIFTREWVGLRLDGVRMMLRSFPGREGAVGASWAEGKL